MDISLTGVKRPHAPSTHDDLAARDTKRPRVEPGSETTPPPATLRDQERTQLLRTCRHELPEAAWNHLSAAIDKAIDPAHASGTLDLSQCDPDACAALPLRVANSIYDHLKAYGCPLRRVVLPAAIESLPPALGHLNDLNRAGRARIVFQGCPVLLRKAARELLIAIRKGDLEATRAALLAGAPVNTTDEHGKSALMHAAMRGDLATINLLIDSGANVHQRKEENHPKRPDTPKGTLTAGSALAYALICGHPDATHSLLKAGANVNETMEVAGFATDQSTPIKFIPCTPHANEIKQRQFGVLAAHGANCAKPVRVLRPDDPLTQLIDNMKCHGWTPTDAEWNELKKAINTPLSNCVAMSRLLDAIHKPRQVPSEVSLHRALLLPSGVSPRDPLLQLEAGLREIMQDANLAGSLDDDQRKLIESLLHKIQDSEARQDAFTEYDRAMACMHTLELIDQCQQYIFSLLGAAAASNNIRMVEQLVAHGANPCQAWSHGRTALATAVDNGDLEMAQLLLQLGAPVSQSVTPKGPSPIHCLSDNVAMANLLLDAGANPNAPMHKIDRSGFASPVYIARMSPQVLAVLLNRGASIEEMIDEYRPFAEQVMASTAKDATPVELEKAELLLAHTTEPNVEMRELFDLIRGLHEGGEVNKIDSLPVLIGILEALVEKGADPNFLANLWRDDNGDMGPFASPSWIEMEVDESVLKKFASAYTAAAPYIAPSADAELTLQGLARNSVTRQTLKPLYLQEPADKFFTDVTPGIGLDPHVFSQMLHLDTQFKSWGLNNLLPNTSKDTLLTRAAKEGDLAAVEQLLSLGADVHQVNRDLVSPLMAAVQMQQLEVVRHLLACGARPNQSLRLWQNAGEPYKTCLSVTISCGNIDIAKALLAGAGNHAPACVSREHIKTAINAGRTDMLELLLAHAPPLTFEDHAQTMNRHALKSAQAIANKLIEQDPPLLAPM